MRPVALRTGHGPTACTDKMDYTTGAKVCDSESPERQPLPDAGGVVPRTAFTTDCIRRGLAAASRSQHVPVIHRTVHRYVTGCCISTCIAIIADGQAPDPSQSSLGIEMHVPLN